MDTTDIKITPAIIKNKFSNFKDWEISAELNKSGEVRSL